MTPSSVKIVYTQKVSCHGDDEWSGHLLVYYPLKEDDKNLYKTAYFYCGKKFIYKEPDE